MIVKVTQEYLDQITDTSYDAQSCPVANALNKQCQNEDHDTLHLVYPSNTKRLIRLPKKLKTALYDNGKKLTDWLTNFDGWQRYTVSKRYNPNEVKLYTKPKPIKIKINHETNEVEIVHTNE